jgi:hypothetical protein
MPVSAMTVDDARPNELGPEPRPRQKARTPSRTVLKFSLSLLAGAVAATIGLALFIPSEDQAADAPEHPLRPRQYAGPVRGPAAVKSDRSGPWLGVAASQTVLRACPADPLRGPGPALSSAHGDVGGPWGPTTPFMMGGASAGDFGSPTAMPPRASPVAHRPLAVPLPSQMATTRAALPHVGDARSAQR